MNNYRPILHLRTGFIDLHQRPKFTPPSSIKWRVPSAAVPQVKALAEAAGWRVRVIQPKIIKNKI